MNAKVLRVPEANSHELVCSDASGWVHHLPSIICGCCLWFFTIWKWMQWLNYTATSLSEIGCFVMSFATHRVERPAVNRQPLHLRYYGVHRFGSVAHQPLPSSIQSEAKWLPWTNNFCESLHHAQLKLKKKTSWLDGSKMQFSLRHLDALGISQLKRNVWSKPLSTSLKHQRRPWFHTLFLQWRGAL